MWENTSGRLKKKTTKGGGIKTYQEKERVIWSGKLAMLWLCLQVPDLFRFRFDTPSRAAAAIECAPLTAVGKEITSRAPQ